MENVEKAKLQREVKSNQQELYIMSPEEFDELQRKSRNQNLDVVKSGAGYIAPALDVKTSLGQVRELGVFGRVVEKVTNGRRYVIFKGHPDLRRLFKGTRYAANNPQVVSMAIGKVGAAKAIVKGAKLTVFLTLPLDILKFLIDEQSTIGSLVGTIVSDIAKLGVASVLSLGAAVAVGAITTVAAGPLIAAIFVGVATSFLLEKVDAEFGLTDALVRYFDELYGSVYDKTIGAIAQKICEVERILIWQAKNKLPVGKGLYY